MLRVSGGVAGVDDEISVDPDGKATLTSKNKKSFDCSVTSATIDAIKSEAMAVNARTEPKKRDRKGLPTSQVYDAFNYMLTIGDKKYRVTNGEKAPQKIQPLLSAMHDVLASAKATRDGEQPPNGTSSCTK